MFIEKPESITSKSDNISLEKQPIAVTVQTLENDFDNDTEIRDKAFAILKGRIDEDYTEEESARVRRKIDWRILPLITMVYGMNYVDKAALSWAVMFNLKKDIHIDGNQYSWVSAIFYFGYLGAEYPANYIIHKFSVSRVICIVCLVWGILLFGHIGVKNYAGLLVIRFILGVSEAPISAACINYVGEWYTKSEQPFRFLCFASGQGGLYIIFSLVAYGLGHVNDASLRPWAYIYLVLACLSIILGTYMWFFLPTLPNEAKFLDEREKFIAVKRVANNMTGVKTLEWDNHQIIDAIKDPKTYFLILYMFFSMIPNGGLTNFNTLVLSSFNFDKYETILVNLPWSFFSAGQMWVWAFFGIYFKNLRILGLTIPMIIAIIGLGIVYGTEDGGAAKWGRVFCYWMINSCSAAFPYAMNLTGQLVSGHTKQSFTNSAVLIAFAVGNIVGPFCFNASDAPKYEHALATIMGCFAVCIVVGAGLGVYIFYENRRRDRLYGNPDKDETLRLEGIINGLKDKTDVENKYFRFVY
ncbi:hypothetical protein C6P40_001807 [Pichia californica]|uniref:Major facilitator superfamily (MFS) profile domain-containing protein n=1 Tax=Pichia californica TaxID=460514 RepID=A0A9P6WQY6_9ASCO|nr:hypothetical protein C6P42_002222 [[Candida] californica]KAG0690718.1 hypothetical protein C6P40_001807 [[Candida] californica]